MLFYLDISAIYSDILDIYLDIYLELESILNLEQSCLSAILSNTQLQEKKMLAWKSCYCQSNQNKRNQKQTILIRLLTIINETEFLSVFFISSSVRKKKPNKKPHNKTQTLNLFLVFFINKPPAVAFPTEQTEV